ncbi:MAG: BCCT family transporter [Gammaproteobacteria bacterium]|nr:MAG: BCCT family transporter [Gammaproteobacteria bacterium]
MTDVPPPEPSADAKLGIHFRVFGIAALLILAFSVFGGMASGTATVVFQSMQAWIVGHLGWFYVLLVAGFLVYALVLAFSRYGEIRLGPDDSRPDYSYASWFAMLFSAGMGIGLMFFGVAEPLLHFAHPPVPGTDPQSVEAAREAMRVSFLHWGFHAWGIYIVIGLSLAYFGFRHGLPLTIRSTLYPVLGERIHGRLGDLVDIFAILGTVFGVATSLGFGAMQVNAGLAFLFGVEVSVGVQLALIALITLIATGSVAAGLDAGIRRLSLLNMVLALFLLLFVLVAGPTVFLLSAFPQNTGSYLSEIFDLSFRQFAYEPTAWMGDWTLFYWGWWIAWSPFVGMFIARISRGRTIREFVIGVLVVPALFTFLWMTIFGNTAIHAVLSGGAPELVAMVDNNLPVALFALFELLPLSQLTSFVAVILVVTFFVTSSDSGSLVTGMISSGGSADPPLWNRVFWAISKGVVAAVLLVAGGLGALQTAAIASALPFTIVMVAICVGMVLALRRERAEHVRMQRPSLPVARAGLDWRKRLGHLVRHSDEAAATRFIESTVYPALVSVRDELTGHGIDAVVIEDDDGVRIEVHEADGETFAYGARRRSYRMVTFAFVETPAADARHRHWYVEAWCSVTADEYDILGLSREQIIDDLLGHYSRWVNARTAPSLEVES